MNAQPLVSCIMPTYNQPGTVEMPSTLASFKDAHRGETIIVCGCGESLNLFDHPERFVTIGVNDIGRRFHPDYLVVVNPRAQFSGDRFRCVETSQARYLFSQYDDLRVPHPRLIKFQLGTRGGTDFSNSNILHFTQNSPYVALCLAIHMGAKRIGLIGVDFTEAHFFGKTGTHPLAGRLGQIDREYGVLAQACRSNGIEIFNLSPMSRLQELPRAGLAEFLAASTTWPGLIASVKPFEPGRVFVVNYRFLSCGNVFGDGLRHAAAEPGQVYEDAYWDDSQLPAKIERFCPDLLFVVHGRRFAQKWRDRFRAFNTAVWLVDEPYEVDDTANWSSFFKTVFVNDPATLHRHHNAHYLPVCFDPRIHRDTGQERVHKVGFVGGFNATRERFLVKLIDAGLLGYVVGGPWRAPALQRLCLAPNVPAMQTAELYQRTEVVVNVFRETHHFNAQGIPAGSMNPRIYEALACGAAVVSERRDEVGQVFPQLPQFDTPEELVSLAGTLLADRERLTQIRALCIERLAGHTYRDRLSRALTVALGYGTADPLPVLVSSGVAPEETAMKPATHPCVNPVLSDRLPASQSASGSVEQTGIAELAHARKPVEFLPFSSMPSRNLLYHVWPVRGSTWRWNLDELKRRIDLFNGRRVIGIVCDGRSEEADAVREYLDGHGCEFIVAPNDVRGEAATFPLMLERVASMNPNELTFYAHAKGVKYEPKFPPSVRRWAEVQYCVTLDDWPAVKEQMQRYAMTGIFRKHGRFANHRNLGDWHYSGTFFWMRHSHVFARRYWEVPEFYGGVEAWPGLHFDRQETGCMFLDNLLELPYQDHFWVRKGESEFQRWKRAVRPVPVPSDLAVPLPFEDHTWPRLEQKPEEFAWWIERLLANQVSSLLTFGSAYGGAEWHIARVFHRVGRNISITVVDTRPRSELPAALEDARAKFGQPMTLITGDSTELAVRSQLAGHYDAVFIDGNHSYRACRNDFLLAKSLAPRIIGFHDIVDSDWHAAARCCVSRLWNEIVSEFRTECRSSGEWGGIGVLYPSMEQF